MSLGGDKRKHLPPDVESTRWITPVMALHTVSTESMSPAGARFGGRKLLFNELWLKLDPQSCSWDRFRSMSDRELLKQKKRKK